ncbi:hypothetical protein MHU86_4520 [Fragilaria crotonensis]|nr:hypothetical protein MHU86_4520 [Fragilaria crotonensis]
MLKTFLLAGAGNEDFRFPLRSTKQRLDQALLDIGYKEKSGAHAHMVAENWRISRAEVLTLIQSQASGTEDDEEGQLPQVWKTRSLGEQVSGAQSNSKKVKDKTFNWCEKCRRWTVTHTTATHTGGERRPPAPAPSPRANLSMLAPDPSVWLLDFPVKPTVTSPPRSLLNLIRGANPWLLFALSLAICAIVPNLVTLAIYLASAIPWSTILAWVANNLHQVLLRHPTLANLPLPRRLPPRLRSLAINVVVSRDSSKSFSAPPRFNAGIRANKLHRSYPLRLRQRGYVASRPPTLAQRDDFRHFATLKERALRLQRRADKLRNSRRPAPLPPTTGQKGEGYKNKRSCPSWCSKRPRSPPRTAKYCPVAPANSPDPFAIAPLTFHQRAAANKILSHVHLACHSTPLRMALRLRSYAKASDPKQTRAPSFGTRAQAFRSRPTSPISKAPSPASRTTSTEDPSLQTSTRRTISQRQAYNATDPFKAADALVSIVNTVHERNLNLNEAERIASLALSLGHVGFKKVQFILRSGVVSKTEESRRLQTAACRLTSFPKCAACQYGKQHRRPIPGTTPSSVVKIERTLLKRTIFSRATHFRSTILFAALVDVYLRWKNETRRHVYRWLHLRRPRLRLHFVEHQVSLNSHETLKAKESFERMCRNTGVTPQEYLADNSKTFTSAEFSRNLAEFHKLSDSLASALTITMESPNATFVQSWPLQGP